MMSKLFEVGLKASLVLFIFFKPFNGQAQKFFSKTYADIPGLSTNVFFDVDQHNNGALWFITQLGVVQYDGKDWIKMPDSLGLPIHEYSTSIALQDGGMAFAGANQTGAKKLSILQEEQWTQIKIPGKPTVFERYHIWENSDDLKMVHCNIDSFFFYSNNQWTGHDLSSQFNILDIKNIRSHQDDFYILSGNGVFKGKNLKDIRRIEFWNDSTMNNSINDLKWNDAGDSLFIIGHDYLGLHTNNQSIVLNRQPNLNQMSGATSSSIVYSYPFVLYTSNSPLYAYNLKEDKSYEVHGHGVEGRTKWNSVITDRQGIIWMAGHRGLSKIPTLAFTNFSNGAFLENEVATVRHLRNGNILLGHNKGFTILDSTMNKITEHFFELTSPLIRVLDAAEDEKGMLYLATSDNGLLRVNPSSQKVDRLNGLHYATCIAIKKDTMWVGSDTSLFTFVDSKIIEKQAVSTIRKLAFNEKNQLMVLTKLGLVKWRLGEHLKLKNYYDDKNNIYFGGVLNNKFLIATLGGLYWYRNGQYTPYTVDGKHFNQPTYTFISDFNKDLWVGTGNGVYQIRANKIINHFTSTNGLVSNEINRAALVFDSTQKLWIGSDKGLSVFNKKFKNPINLPPIVSIDGVENAGISYMANTPQSFSFKNRDATFKFSAHSFYDEFSINFEFMLEGFDKDWSHLDAFNQRTVKYENLPPGEYKFKVRARESKRQWSPVASSASIEILSPFYFSWWFALLVILLIAIITSVATSLINQKKLAINLDKKLKIKMREVFKSQNELSLQNDELKKLNTELDSFVYSVSHDLRAPIASSLGLINLMKLDQSNTDEYFSLIEKSMHHMDSFIQDILEVSRNSRKEVKIDVVDFKKLVNSVIENQKFRPGAEKIKFHIFAENKTIKTDKNRLFVVLTNLISNAINYSDPNKEIQEVNISYSSNQHQQLISVRDNGIGIKKEFLEYLFDIFFRANENKAGSGLGLYIADQTMKKLNGAISVESEHGQYTLFKITFPFLQEE